MKTNLFNHKQKTQMAQKISKEEIEKTMNAHGFCGLAKRQTEIFLGEIKKDILDKNSALLGLKAEVGV